MTAYLIDKFDIVDEPRFDDYVREVMPLIAKHHGTVHVGGKAECGLEGPKRSMKVTVAFPSEDEATAFYEDPDYQPVKDIRLAATANPAAVISSAFEA